MVYKKICSSDSGVHGIMLMGIIPAEAAIMNGGMLYNLNYIVNIQEAH